MSDAGSIKTSITLPAGLHWQFQEEVARRRTTNKAAIEDALRRWVNAPNAGGGADDHSVTLKNECRGEESSSAADKMVRKLAIVTREIPWIAKLLSVLRSTDYESIGAVQANLNVFCRGHLERNHDLSALVRRHPSATAEGENSKAG